MPTVTSPDRKDEVDEYVRTTSSRSDLDRTSSKEKTGVFTGGYAIHPLTGERVPVWIGDYVLGSYGTGAVMAVPAHDDRDLEFATKFGLGVKRVVAPAAVGGGDDVNDDDGIPMDAAFTEQGVNVNSGDFDGMTTTEANKAITDRLEELNSGGPKITYKLRDWVFSRQRYWGEPIPIYFPMDFPEGVDHADANPREDGSEHVIRYDLPIPVDDADLPLTLPEMENFSPGDDPAGCLARAKDWRYFQKDGRWYARETNTMPQWAGSCWYYFRFLDPKNGEKAFSPELDEDWMPVDLYVGGAEHAVLHLLYARFWHQVLFDLGYTKHPEPFQKLVHQGMILGSDGEKVRNGLRMPIRDGQLPFYSRPNASYFSFFSPPSPLFLDVEISWKCGEPRRHRRRPRSRRPPPLRDVHGAIGGRQTLADQSSFRGCTVPEQGVQRRAVGLAEWRRRRDGCRNDQDIAQDDEEGNGRHRKHVFQHGHIRDDGPDQSLDIVEGPSPERGGEEVGSHGLTICSPSWRGMLESTRSW